MKNLAWIFPVGVLFAAGSLVAKPDEKVELPRAISAPRPEYPEEARAKRMTGSGCVELQIDSKTGYVTAGRLLKSTGHAILDNAALSAFTRWRFKPNPNLHRVRIPIDYTMTGRR